MICPRCKSKNVIKYGFRIRIKKKPLKTQKYICYTCFRNLNSRSIYFTGETK